MRTPVDWLARTVLFAALVATPRSSFAQTTESFSPTADAYVSSAFSGTNYGTVETLRADTAPDEQAYLKFNATLPAGATITAARLYLYTSTTQSQSGVFIRSSPNLTWSEASLVYTNRPPLGPEVGRTGGWTSPGWKVAELALTGVSSGEQTFVVIANNEYLKVFESREGTHPPRLEITYVVRTPADPSPNCIGEPDNHPSVTYPEQRVFIESQGWWSENENGVIAKYGDAEHLHIGACFPLQQGVSGWVRLDFRAVGHNLPAGSRIEGTRFHDGNNGTTLVNVGWNRTIAAGEDDVTLWRTEFVDTRKGEDGLRETRPLTTVHRHNGAELHTSGGWCWDVNNGRARTDHDLCTARRIEGRGWYDCFEYKVARSESWTYPYAGIPSGQDYVLSKVKGSDGAGGTTEIDRHWATVDPEFHAGTTGTFVLDHPGLHSAETITVPAANLTPGIHFLFIMSEEAGQCTTLSADTAFPDQIVPQNGEISGGIRIPLKVNP